MKIVVIGTGNIGRRHIQAIHKLLDTDISFELICYDINEKSIELLKHFIEVEGFKFPNIRTSTTIDSIEEFIDHETIIIVATTANNRLEIFNKIIPCRPTAIIAEKPLAQSQDEYNAIEKLSTKFNVPIYLNFIARAQPVYNEIRDRIINSKEGIIYTNMPCWGLSTVGIHQIDLYIWLFDLKNVQLYCHTLEKVYEQKRKGYYDMAGALFFNSDQGKKAVINNHKTETLASIQIITDEVMYNVLEPQNKLVVLEKGKEIVIKDLNIVFVSQYIHQVIQDIQMGKKPFLPDIQETKLAHSLLFKFIRDNNIHGLNIT